MEATPEMIRNLIPVVAIAGSSVIMAVWIICCTIRRAVQSRAFEQSRREIAAYISEGSISPQDGANLLAIQRKPPKPKDAAKRLALQVALGGVTKQEAKALADARDGVSETTWCDMVDLCIRGLPVEEAVKLARSRAGSPQAS